MTNNKDDELFESIDESVVDYVNEEMEKYGEVLSVPPLTYRTNENEGLGLTINTPSDDYRLPKKFKEVEVHKLRGKVILIAETQDD